MAEKKIKFPSEEWNARYVEELNKNKEYAEAAKNWEGDFLFIVNVGPKVEEEVVTWMDLWHGKVREWSMLPNREAKKTEFIYEGTYESWKGLIEGKIDPVRGLLTRKFKLTGSMAKIMRNTKAAAEMANNCKRVPTEFT